MLTEALYYDDPTDYPKYLAANWEVYIGNSPVWHENQKCPDGPWLKSDYKDVFSDSTHPTLGKMVPAFGFRKVCNMLGTFTHYVAHTIPTESVTLCDTAVLGTYYIRD